MCKTNNNIEEIWRDVPNYEGKYQVSNLGRIKSLRDRYNPREKIMKPQLTKFGYYLIGLCKNGKEKKILVHRLVALAFISNPDNLPCVNHKDEDKTNNCVDNLEWCDQKYNINYGNGIYKRVKNTNWEKRKEKTLNRKDCSKPIIQFDLEGNFIAEYPSIKEAERQNEFYHSNIWKCLKGKRKTAYGFIWKYKE